MTDSRSQSTYQVRLAWGPAGLSRLAQAGIVVIVDVLDSTPVDASVNARVNANVNANEVTSGAVTSGAAAHSLADIAAAHTHNPTVFIGSLRNAAATARAAYEEQLARGGRTAINLVLVGDELDDGAGNGAREETPGEIGGIFAVEDYLAAGAIGDALSALGIDHSAPDVAVATEGFRALTRALKHLVSATSAGLELAAAGRRDEVRAAAEHDAETQAVRFAN